MFSFQKLEVYSKAKKFHIECKKLTTGKHEAYVKDQLGRASYSIVLNIAEGSGRFTKADRRNFFITARASVFECVAIIDLLNDQMHLSEESYKVMLTEAAELSKILYAMVKTLSQ